MNHLICFSICSHAFKWEENTFSFRCKWHYDSLIKGYPCYPMSWEPSGTKYPRSGFATACLWPPPLAAKHWRFLLVPSKIKLKRLETIRKSWKFWGCLPRTDCILQIFIVKSMDTKMSLYNLPLYRHGSQIKSLQEPETKQRNIDKNPGFPAFHFFFVPSPQPQNKQKVLLFKGPWTERPRVAQADIQGENRMRARGVRIHASGTCQISPSEKNRAEEAGQLSSTRKTCNRSFHWI